MVDRVLAPYALLVWAWCRAAAQYPVSLMLLTLALLGAIGSELVALLFVFGHTEALGGFTLAEALLVYGLAVTSFRTADLLLGNTERLGEHIRDGSFDVMLVRPVAPLVQLATDGFSPRRVGSVVPGVAALAVGLASAGVEWTAGRVAALAVLLASGTALCCAVWLAGACLQFFVTEARQLAHSVTYGGQALTEYPLSLYPRAVVRAVTFVVPLAFVSYQPALYLLDRPDPLGLWPGLRHLCPAVAVLGCVLAALAWRAGLRHYRSTGS